MSEQATPDPPSLGGIVELLARHRRVESLVHRQTRDGARHLLVEELVHKQHLAQLRARLVPQPTSVLVALLESLPPEDGQLVWDVLAESRGGEILESLPQGFHDALSLPPPAPTDGPRALQVYEYAAGRLHLRPVASREALAATRPVWIDLLAPDARTCEWVATSFGLDLPDPERLARGDAGLDIEVADDGTLALTAGFLTASGERIDQAPVRLLLRGDLLVTVRAVEIPVFRLQRLRARFQGDAAPHGGDLLLDLFATGVEHAATVLEEIYGTLDTIGNGALTPALDDTAAADVLARIALQEDRNGRLRRNLHETRRALSHLLRSRRLDDGQQEAARQTLRDIDSLDGHTSFLFGKINFLLDATIGFINISQNRRVAQLTRVGVVLTPINILVGIGGMSEFSALTAPQPWPVSYGALLLTLSLGSLLLWVWVRRADRPTARAPRTLSQNFHNARLSSLTRGAVPPHQTGLPREH